MENSEQVMEASAIPVLQPGIHTDISHTDYHALPYVSNSYLGKLVKCPAAAKVPQEDTAALLFGRAVHCLVLEGEEQFDSEFIVAPQCDRRTKEGKATMAAFQASANGRGVLTADEFEAVLNMRNAVQKHPFAADLLSQGMSEVTVIWDDQPTGIRCRCRPDRTPNHLNKVLLDLKTTADASVEGFTRSVVNYGYARQAAFYLEGMSEASRDASWVTEGIFAVIAVEKEAPYRVEVYTLDREFMEYGRKQFRELLTVELACREAGWYPHFRYPQATEIALPGYLQRATREGVTIS